MKPADLFPFPFRFIDWQRHYFAEVTAPRMARLKRNEEKNAFARELPVRYASNQIVLATLTLSGHPYTYGTFVEVSFRSQQQNMPYLRYYEDDSFYLRWDIWELADSLTKPVQRMLGQFLPRRMVAIRLEDGGLGLRRGDKEAQRVALWVNIWGLNDPNRQYRRTNTRQLLTEEEDVV